MRFLALFFALFLTPAWAQYPERAVKIIVPFGAGGIADVTARVVAEKLKEQMGQAFIVENIPGAGGKVAARAVLNAPADGYTLALFTNGTAISAGLFKDLGFNPLSDFIPISNLGNFDFLFVVHKDAPYTNFADFIKAGKSGGKKLNIGTINSGSTQNLTAQYVLSKTGIDAQIVPHRTSGEAIIALRRQDIDLVIDGLVAVQSGFQDGAIKTLTTSKEFDIVSWNALFAKTGVPQAIITRLNSEIKTALADKSVIEKLKLVGIDAASSTPQEIGARLASDIPRWAKVIDEAKIEKQ